MLSPVPSLQMIKSSSFFLNNCVLFELHTQQFTMWSNLTTRFVVELSNQTKYIRTFSM